MTTLMDLISIKMNEHVPMTIYLPIFPRNAISDPNAPSTNLKQSEIEIDYTKNSFDYDDDVQDDTWVLEMILCGI